MATPHDYVVDPVPSVPLHARGRATFRELAEIFAIGRHVALVGRDDAEMGPYTHCILVSVSDVDTCCSRGYRRLSSSERREAGAIADDVDDATD
jgi:hypothetical protein